MEIEFVRFYVNELGVLRCMHRCMQFSVTEHFKSTEAGLFQTPHGVYFFYDLSPIKVGFSFYFRQAGRKLGQDFAASQAFIQASMDH